VAINAIMAQSLFTARAESYNAPFYHVMSSMALQDNLEAAESYYIVEIKSLKRILDAVHDKSAVPVLCFIDEVLRGTNTVERIAASTEILKELAEHAGSCFVATHDIELTYRLEGFYANYHFEEQVDGDNVTFDYCLHKGRATTRNAIKLLGMMGFDKAIVEAAQRSAENMSMKDFSVG
jgi:DNA mismatch repair ATPase MutS